MFKLKRKTDTRVSSDHSGLRGGGVKGAEVGHERVTVGGKDGEIGRTWEFGAGSLTTGEAGKKRSLGGNAKTVGTLLDFQSGRGLVQRKKKKSSLGNSKFNLNHRQR